MTQTKSCTPNNLNPTHLLAYRAHLSEHRPGSVFIIVPDCSKPNPLIYIYIYTYMHHEHLICAWVLLEHVTYAQIFTEHQIYAWIFTDHHSYALMFTEHQIYAWIFTEHLIYAWIFTSASDVCMNRLGPFITYGTHHLFSRSPILPPIFSSKYF